MERFLQILYFYKHSHREITGADIEKTALKKRVNFLKGMCGHCSAIRFDESDQQIHLRI